MSKKEWYAIYNSKDELLYVGTAQECADFLNMKNSSIRNMVHRTKHGLARGKTYTAYKLEDDDYYENILNEPHATA